MASDDSALLPNSDDSDVICLKTARNDKIWNSNYYQKHDNFIIKSAKIATTYTWRF